MILDDFGYEKYLLENSRQIFTQEEIDRLKKIFNSSPNYIKKNWNETEVYCFLSYLYILSLEKFKNSWIISQSDPDSPSSNIHTVFPNFPSAVREIQDIVHQREEKILDYRSFSDSKRPWKKVVEKLGVATQVEPALEVIYRAILPIASGFLERDTLNDEVKISIPWIKFREAWRGNEEDLIKFPLEKADIKIHLKRIKKLDFRGKYTVAGLAQNISEKEDSPDESFLALASPGVGQDLPQEIEKTITGRFEFTIRVSNVFEGPVVDELFREIRATISHELSHLNEFYQRHLTGQKKQTFSLSWAGGKNYNLPKPIWKLWYRFHYLVYISEPYEQNAVVQEAWEFVKTMSLEEFKRTNFWENAQKMKNFSPEASYRDLLEAIHETTPHLEESILTRLKNWFIKDYQELETRSKDSKQYQDIVSSKDVFSIMKMFQKRINYAGRDMEKKLLRLFSLKD